MPEAPATSPAARLGAFLAAEIETPLGPGVAATARTLAGAICERHGPAVCAVLLYGSCLRRDSDEGVMDFYAIVDGHRAAGSGPVAAALGAVLPPNVHYLEVDAGGRRLRTKYNVVTLDQLARAVKSAWPDCRLWVRLCQPLRLVVLRDAVVRERLAAVLADAVQTAVGHMLAWLPGGGGEREVSPAELWASGFRETYRSEFRGESAASIDQLHASQAGRYRAVTPLALAALAARGRLVHPGDGPLRVRLDPRELTQKRAAWKLRRLLTKAIAVLGLLKTPVTFEGWASYALWKLERHGMPPVRLTPRQERWPLIFGWGVIFRLLRDGVLR